MLIQLIQLCELRPWADLRPRPKEKEKVGVFETWVQRRIFRFEVSTCESAERIRPVQDRDKMWAYVIIIFINHNWVVTRWQWLFYMYTNYEIG